MIKIKNVNNGETMQVWQWYTIPQATINADRRNENNE